MTFNAKFAIADTLEVIPALFTTQATSRGLYRVALLISDTVMLLLAFALAYWLRFYAGLALSTDVIPSLDEYVRITLMLAPVWLILFTLLRLYDFQYLLGGTSEYVRVLNGCTSGMMLVVIFSFLAPEFVISRGWPIMSWVFSSLLICTNRLILRRTAYALRTKGWFVTPAVIVGTNSEAVSLAMQLRESSNSGICILGFIEEHNLLDLTQSSLIGLPILGGLDSLPQLLERMGAEEVIIATTALTRTQLLETAQELAATPQVKMSLSSGLYEIFTTGMQVTSKGSVPLMSLNRLRLDPIEMALKTVLDCTLILSGMTVLLPLFVMIILLIKLDSPGPIFHRRRVLGIGGKEFDAFKFRTMVVNGDAVLEQHPELLAELQATHKLKNDPRITRVGQWLRRASIDELPQILNILLGQMSLVGPRMISPAEGAMYGPMKHDLLTVKPGLTGLWQVSGRSDLSYDERVRLDMQYIRNYSIWLDLQILVFQTLPAVLKGSGAY
jgi:exopolysaccharide biosynthesis polyprenyl glycosylphosphotransferase